MPVSVSLTESDSSDWGEEWPGTTRVTAPTTPAAVSSEECDWSRRSEPTSLSDSEAETEEVETTAAPVPVEPSQPPRPTPKPPACPPPQAVLAKAKGKGSGSAASRSVQDERAMQGTTTQSPDITVTWNHRVAPLLPQMKSEAFPRSMVRPTILKCNPKAVAARPKPSMKPPPGVW